MRDVRSSLCFLSFVINVVNRFAKRIATDRTDLIVSIRFASFQLLSLSLEERSFFENILL